MGSRLQDTACTLARTARSGGSNGKRVGAAAGKAEARRSCAGAMGGAPEIFIAFDEGWQTP